MQVSRNIPIAEGKELSSARSGILGIVSVFLLGTLTLGARVAAEQVKIALSLCARSVLPSVFPLMVVSNLLTLGGGGELAGRIFGGFTEKVFGVSASASSSVILGFLCGFPVGASSAARLYRNGCITRDEFSRLLTFVNNPSATFVIYAVGGNLFGSVRLGTVIYVCVIISALTVGAVSSAFRRSSRLVASPSKMSKIPISKLISSSVSGAALSCLNVCAYTAFFSATVGVLSVILTRMGVPYFVKAAIHGIFELVGGVNSLSALNSRLLSVLAVTAACSWSGLSVIGQIISVCDCTEKDGVSFAPMIVSKIMQALLSPLLVYLYISATRFDI